MLRTSLCALLTLTTSLAQSFDVASVKPARGTDPRVGYWISGNSGVKLTALNQNLLQLIQRGYELTEYQIFGPDWLKGQKYEIRAKMFPGTPIDDVPAAVRTLLADRFKLVTHRETRDLPMYELTVAKGGPKLTRSAGKGGTTQIRGLYKARNESIAQLCQSLARTLDRAVVDHTGLRGRYDFVLDYTAFDPRTMDPGGEPSVFRALERQLGLKLESRKGPVEVLVIDSAQKMPTAN